VTVDTWIATGLGGALGRLPYRGLYQTSACQGLTSREPELDFLRSRGTVDMRSMGSFRLGMRCIYDVYLKGCQ